MNVKPNITFKNKLVSMNPTISECINVLFNIYEKILEPYDHLIPADIKLLEKIDIRHNFKQPCVDCVDCIDIKRPHITIVTPANSLASSYSEKRSSTSNLLLEDDDSYAFSVNCNKDSQIQSNNITLFAEDVSRGTNVNIHFNLDEDMFLLRENMFVPPVSVQNEDEFFDVDLNPQEPPNICLMWKDRIKRISFSSSDSDSWEFIDNKDA
jgi:hypothetical protein